MTSAAQKKANAKYLREKVKRKSVDFYGTDADLIEWLETKDNFQGYIKQLIREDMERQTTHSA